MILETEIQMNLPSESGEYKCVQLHMDDNNYLGIGQHGESHATILTRLLEKEGSRWTKAYWKKYSFCRDCKLPDDFRGKEYKRIADPLFNRVTPEVAVLIPELSGQDYKVMGMGKAFVELETKTIALRGKSMSYGICIDHSWTNNLKRVLPDWSVESKQY